MRFKHLTCLPVISSVLFCTAGAAGARAQTPAAPPAPSVASGSLQSFGFDDLMSMLVQPRHIKLYYAGMAGNWELAAAEARNLRSALGRIGQMIPRYLDAPVADTTNAMIGPKLDAIDIAIAAGDVGRFKDEYARLTNACNACHVYMEHPYIVIQIPIPTKRSAYGDQRF